MQGFESWGTEQLAINATQQLLATGSADNRIRLWRIADGALLQELVECEPGKNCSDAVLDAVALSSNGHYLASEGLSTRLWRISDGALLHTFTQVGARALAFSPDSQLLVAADNATVRTADGTGHALRFWRVADQQEVRTILVNEQPTSLAFSPDGQWLAVGFQGSQFFAGHVRVWQVDSADPTPTYDFAPTQWVFSVAWSPDGRYLAAGGASFADSGWALRSPAWLRGPQRLAVWQMDGVFQGWQAQSIWTRQEASRALAFTPDGSHLVAGGGEINQSFKVFRFVPLPVPPSVLVGASLLISIGLWARSRWRGHTG